MKEDLDMNVALVHDYLAQAGGAERVVEALHALYPDAPVYTSVYDRKAMPASFAAMDVRTSFLQHWPLATRRLHKLALPLYPAAFEQMELSAYDVVVSSSSAFAKGVLTGRRRATSATATRPPDSPGATMSTLPAVGPRAWPRRCC